jgi:hypothetical protein
MFSHLYDLPQLFRDMALMDRDGYSMQGEFLPLSTPARKFAPMPTQSLVSWTLPRLAAAGIAWLTVETLAVQAQPVTAAKRRV